MKKPGNLNDIMSIIPSKKDLGRKFKVSRGWGNKLAVVEELPMSLLLKKKRGKDRLEHEHALALLKTSHIRRENRILWVSTILSFTIATLAVIFRG